MKNFDSFTKYDLTISRLKESEIELLRSWRNEPEIAKQMKAQNGREITKEEQITWFESIKDRDDALYYLYYYNGKPTGGYVCIKNINWQEGTGEPGGFSYYATKSLIDTFDPKWIYFGAFVLYDFCFEIMGLKKLSIEIKNSNKRAIRINKSLGYKRAPQHDDGEFLAFCLNKDDYYKKRDEILKIIIK